MSEQASQFNTSNLLAAIEATSAEMTAKSDRITALEATNYRLQEENEELRAQLQTLFERVQATKAALAAARQSAEQAEATAAAHLNRADHLETELVAANDDIANIASAVTSLLAGAELRR